MMLIESDDFTLRLNYQQSEFIVNIETAFSHS